MWRALALVFVASALGACSNDDCTFRISPATTDPPTPCLSIDAGVSQRCGGIDGVGITNACADDLMLPTLTMGPTVAIAAGQSARYDFFHCDGDHVCHISGTLGTQPVTLTFTVTPD